MYAAIMYIHIQSCLVFTTPPPQKKTDPLQLSSFHHKSGSLQTLRSSPSIWRDWLQSRVTPTVGKQCSKNGKTSMGGKSSQTEDLWFGRRKKFEELKFHRPTRHSLRVEKTQLLDVAVEGDIRKLISWIHDSTHVQIWNIHIRYITICIHVQILNIQQIFMWSTFQGLPIKPQQMANWHPLGIEPFGTLQVCIKYWLYWHIVYL